MWQALQEELGDRGFTVVAVAMDSRGLSSVEGPIRKAGTTYVSLLDRDHIVSDLFNLVNVPQAVWIDEVGRLVRPPENAGAQMSFNFKKVRRTRAIYLDAIRDWVAKGEGSEHVFSDEALRARLVEFTPAIAEAHASFHLGRHLWEHGSRREAASFLRRAVDLNPDSWSFFRQMKNLEHILGSGGPEFMRRVRKRRKEGKDYYPLPDMAPMAEVSD